MGLLARGRNTSRNILLIEDDEDIRAIIKDALEWDGYHVYTASNGKEGMEILPQMPAPSLILLDLMMPVMNGGPARRGGYGSHLVQRYYRSRVPGSKPAGSQRVLHSRPSVSHPGNQSSRRGRYSLAVRDA